MFSFTAYCIRAIKSGGSGLVFALQHCCTKDVIEIRGLDGRKDAQQCIRQRVKKYFQEAGVQTQKHKIY